MTRARDVADTQDNLGGAVAPFVAGKNKIINGDFGIWQRGTTLNLPSGTSSYLADRFNIRVDSPSGTPVYSRQTFTPGTAPVTGYEGQFFARFTTGGNVACSVFCQNIEDVRTFAGQTVTLSFWMKTSTAKTFTMLLRQDFGSGGSSIVDLTASYTTTTSWARYTQTFNLASITGKTIGTNSSLLLQTIAYGSQTGNFDVDIWGVQLEAGSVMSPFTTASGSIGGELALCQRYYYRTTLSPSSAAIIGFGTGVSTTAALIGVRLPVTMRTYPSSTVESSGLWIFDGAFSINTSAGITTGGGLVPDPNMMNILATGSGITQYRPYYLYASTTTAFLGITAEL
jgi:hypothetical protein